MCRAIKAIKDAVPDIGVLTDVALDPYTSHGHDGMIDASGYVLNDETIDGAGRAGAGPGGGRRRHRRAVGHDGRPRRRDPRRRSRRAGTCNIAIMAYAAKYASAFYGPFRDAVGSRGLLKGDKSGYQMDPANADEALREVALDLAEGADMVMVKPGPALSRHRRRRGGASSACRSSPTRCRGEYAMIEAAAAAGAGDRDALILETLLAFKRAGATGVLTYHALDAARLIHG